MPNAELCSSGVLCRSAHGPLEIVRMHTGMLRDPRQHAGAYLLTVMECKYCIGQHVTGEHTMRAGLALDPPADALQRGKDPPGSCRRPVGHARSPRQSSCAKVERQQTGGRLPILEPIGEHAQREGLGA